MIIDLINKITYFVSRLRTEHIALISVLTTFIIFMMGKRRESRLKIYETRKRHYQKLIRFFENVAMNSKEPKKIEKMKDSAELHSLGSSLAIFGSRKLYKTYCFYREVANNQELQKTKYYSNEFMVFIIGDMYRIMRKEIGLYKHTLNVTSPNMLSFFVNDITKPDYMKKYYKYRFNKIALRTFIIVNKFSAGLPLYWFYYCILKPILHTIFLLIYIFIKLTIIKPLRYIRKKG
ncbi:MAG: hypothetical protein FWE02_07060 [Defluviitaleaceae bacterium]|nr:hypothetical protein [Defluviitaleaceae bacterium]